MSLLTRGSHWKRAKPGLKKRAAIMRAARKRIAASRIASTIKKNMFKIKRAFKTRKLLYNRGPMYRQYRR